MKYYLISGEASGDLHASNLMKAILQKDENAEFRFWGGDLMKNVGGTLVKHYKDLAFMGFWEVIKNIRTLTGFIDLCKEDIKIYQPDAVILVDYAGFNLRIAKFVHALGIPTHFYIAPKVWAWNEKRVEKLKKYVNHLYVIFPFEKPYFEEKHQYPVHFVGNPLQDVIEHYPPVNEKLFRDQHQLDERPIIALLPGSRTQEIKHMLPLMAKNGLQFLLNINLLLLELPTENGNFTKAFAKNYDVKFIENETYNLLDVSYAALVTSGTATLETALFKVPQVVCYHSSAVSYFIAKNLVKDLKYISLVNLVMDAPVVTELIQNDFNEIRLQKELSLILNEDFRQQMFENYLTLEEKTGGEGASKKVAKIIVESLKV